MYYYGYSGGYGYNNPCCGGNQGGYVYPVNTGYGYNNGSGAAIILVLFISASLLSIFVSKIGTKFALRLLKSITNSVMPMSFSSLMYSYICRISSLNMCILQNPSTTKGYILFREGSFNA